MNDSGVNIGSYSESAIEDDKIEGISEKYRVLMWLEALKTLRLLTHSVVKRKHPLYESPSIESLGKGVNKNDPPLRQNIVPVF